MGKKMKSTFIVAASMVLLPTFASADASADDGYADLAAIGALSTAEMDAFIIEVEDSIEPQWLVDGEGNLSAGLANSLSIATD